MRPPTRLPRPSLWMRPQFTLEPSCRVRLFASPRAKKRTSDEKMMITNQIRWGMQAQPIACLCGTEDLAPVGALIFKSRGAELNGPFHDFNMIGHGSLLMCGLIWRRRIVDASREDTK